MLVTSMNRERVRRIHSFYQINPRERYIKHAAKFAKEDAADFRLKKSSESCDALPLPEMYTWKPP